MSRPTCQSHTPLKRRPDAGVACARQLCGRCRHLTFTLSTDCHVRSTCDVCSRRPVRHLVTLSVHRRSRLSTSRDSHRMSTNSALLLRSASAPSSPRSSAPSAEVLTTAHRSQAPLSHAKSAAEPPSTARNRRSTEPAASFSCQGCLPVNRHLRPPMCSSVTAATSARAHRHSTNREPAPSTSSPACHRQFPTTDLPHHREPTTVSPSTTYAPNRDLHLRGELPGTSSPGHSPPVGRNRPVSRAPVRNGGAPLFRPSGPKGPSGPSTTVGVTHCNSAIFLLSFELFKIQFKFSLNF
jgi:hypothetical protein